MCTGRLFPSRGPADAKARSPRREFVLIMAHVKLSDDRS